MSNSDLASTSPLLVSVIVPVYRVEPYLRHCIDSILSQTYQNLEVILVNDGSPDRCPDICEEYRNRDLRIKVIHKSNGGLSDARNAGLDRATGDFVTFVDSDDWLASTMVATLVEACLTNGAEVASCRYAVVTNHVQRVPPHTARHFVMSGREALDILVNTTKYEESLFPAVSWAKIYRAELFRARRFPFGRIHEDEFITYKVLFATKVCVGVDSPLYNYRIRPGSLTRTLWRDPKALADKIVAFEERFAFLEKEDARLALPAATQLLRCYLFVYHTLARQRRHSEMCEVLKRKIYAMCRDHSHSSLGWKERLWLWIFKLRPTLYVVLLSVRLMMSRLYRLVRRGVARGKNPEQLAN